MEMCNENIYQGMKSQIKIFRKKIFIISYFHRARILRLEASDNFEKFESLFPSLEEGNSGNINDIYGFCFFQNIFISYF